MQLYFLYSLVEIATYEASKQCPMTECLQLTSCNYDYASLDSESYPHQFVFLWLSTVYQNPTYTLTCSRALRIMTALLEGWVTIYTHAPPEMPFIQQRPAADLREAQQTPSLFKRISSHYH